MIDAIAPRFRGVIMFVPRAPADDAPNGVSPCFEECPAAAPDEVRQIVGISDGLLRPSIGLEHLDDLIAGQEKGFGA